jgi:hypothetical protein
MKPQVWLSFEGLIPFWSGAILHPTHGIKSPIQTIPCSDKMKNQFFVVAHKAIVTKVTGN